MGRFRAFRNASLLGWLTGAAACICGEVTLSLETTLDAWCKGYTARWAGTPSDANPYADHPGLARAWSKGWQTSQSPQHISLSFGGQPPDPA
jgi:hypothetical protein